MRLIHIGVGAEPLRSCGILTLCSGVRSLASGRVTIENMIMRILHNVGAESGWVRLPS